VPELDCTGRSAQIGQKLAFFARVYRFVTADSGGNDGGGDISRGDFSRRSRRLLEMREQRGAILRGCRAAFR
jgi:hypothetical protein